MAINQQYRESEGKIVAAANQLRELERALVGATERVAQLEAEN